MRLRVGTAAFGFILFGCREPAAPPLIDQSNPLEKAAVDANLVDDPTTLSPTGLYEHRHAIGTDAICITEGENDALNFGMTAVFAPTLICEGRGTAIHQGSTVALLFDGVACRIEASYDGRSLRVPGVVPEGCAALCGPRASLSGVKVERVGWDQQSTRGLTSRRDEIAGRAPRRMCPAG